MSITKFTNLSGNQVPLVLLHINSVNIILKDKYKAKMIKSKIKEHQETYKKKIYKEYLFLFLLFSFPPLGVLIL